MDRNIQTLHQLYIRDSGNRLIHTRWSGYSSIEKDDRYINWLEDKLLEKLEEKPKSEKKYYIINLESVDGIIRYWKLSDSEFMDMAEEQGTVYSEKGFVKAYNHDEIPSSVTVIRII